MNQLIKQLAAVALTTVFAVPFAMASTPAEVYNQCKKEAVGEEVASSEMEGYIRQCMEDRGIDSADIDAVFQEMAPKSGGEEN